MAIAPVNVGDFVYQSKINELIASINQLTLSAVNFNGATGVIRQATPDIASVTRLGAGAYRINFAALRETPYVPIVCSTIAPGQPTGFQTLNSIAPGSFVIQTGSNNGPQPTDPDIVCAIIFG